MKIIHASVLNKMKKIFLHILFFILPFLSSSLPPYFFLSLSLSLFLSFFLSFFNSTILPFYLSFYLSFVAAPMAYPGPGIESELQLWQLESFNLLWPAGDQRIASTVNWATAVSFLTCSATSGTLSYLFLYFNSS